MSLGGVELQDRQFASNGPTLPAKNEFEEKTLSSTGAVDTFAVGSMETPTKKLPVTAVG